MLSVAVHKDLGEYQPKIIGKMTARTLLCITGALGLSVITGCYMYFVLGMNVTDNMIIIYGVSLPFWLCGFFRPKGMPFEKFFPLWLSYKFSDNRLHYTATLYRIGLADAPNSRKKEGKVYAKAYRKLLRRNGIEAYSPRAGKGISGK